MVDTVDQLVGDIKGRIDINHALARENHGEPAFAGKFGQNLVGDVLKGAFGLLDLGGEGLFAFGAFLALRLLRKSAEVVYDVTFGYHGLTAADYGEQIFTLKAMFLMGRGPKKVHIHIRSFAIADIPLGDDDDCVDVDKLDPILMKNFEEWLFGIWYEKDQLMTQFFETGSFVDPDDATAQSLTSDFKARSTSEYAVPFMTLGAILLALYWVAKSVVVPFAKCVYNVLQIHRTTAYIL